MISKVHSVNHKLLKNKYLIKLFQYAYIIHVCSIIWKGLKNHTFHGSFHRVAIYIYLVIYIH